jgi:phenylacetate-coenzyme A ligase PaaK-like adenylate-forming protein
MSAPAWHEYASIQPSIARHFGCPCVIVSGTFLPRFADRIVDAIRAFRPRFLTMFLPMVFSILATARRQGLSGEQLFDGIETLVVTGAPITPGMRLHLQELTKVKRVTELAGSSENLLAVDCIHAQGLHLVPDTCYAEVIDRKTMRAMPDNERGAVVHSSVIPAGSLYLRYDGGDVGIIDRSPCPCGLPSPRIKLLGRRDDCFALGPHTLLPYDVQLALESDVPELRGTAFVISKEGLTEGTLRLLLVEPENSPAGLLSEAGSKLSRRFDVAVEINAMRELPLRFKGVPPILSEREAAAAV